MTINVSACSVRYQGDGATTGFPFVFRVLAKSHLSVIVTNADGIATQADPSTFTVAGTFPMTGGTVVYGASSPVPAGSTVDVVRTVPLTQPTDIINQDGFYPDTLEAALDYLVMQNQQLQERAGRAIVVPRGESGLDLPTIAHRSGKLALFSSAAGAPLVAVSTDDARVLFKGDPGAGGTAVGLYASLSGLTIPGGTDLIQTSGNASKGVGAARYAIAAENDTAAAAAGLVVNDYTARTANGRWFQLAENWVTPQMLGAAADAIEITDAVTTNNSAVVTSAGGRFKASHVGKTISLASCGTAGVPLLTTVLSFQSATQVTLAAQAQATRTGVQAVFGTDDTVPIRHMFDYLSAKPNGGTAYFPAALYLTTHQAHPSQPPGPFTGQPLGTTVIFKIGDRVRMLGEGRGRSRIFATFPWIGSVPGTDAQGTVVFGHGEHFAAEGLTFLGDYQPAAWAFLPSWNGNAMVMHTPAVSGTTGQQVDVYGCEFRNLPGFYVGTGIVDRATFINNVVDHCANGYNISGRDVLVGLNTLRWSEGIESAGMSADAAGTGGRIAVVNNEFFECTVAASLGGNTGTAGADKSYSYAFASNTLRNEVYHTSAPVVITNNAYATDVSGNSISGLIDYGLIITNGGTTATPGEVTISANHINIDPGSGQPAAIHCAQSASTVYIRGNTLIAGSVAWPGAAVLADMGSNAASIVLSGNTLVGRLAVSFTTGQTGVVNWGKNDFIPLDAAYAFDFLGGDFSAATFVPITERVPVITGAEAVTTPHLVVRHSGVGSGNVDSFSMYTRRLDGWQGWGDPAGGQIDTNLYRAAVGVLKSDQKIVAAGGLGAGNAVASGAAMGAITQHIPFYAADGVTILCYLAGYAS